MLVCKGPIIRGSLHSFFHPKEPFLIHYFFFRINDRLISANGISLENVDYGRAVAVLRDSGAAVQLVVKRRIVLPHAPEAQTMKVALTKNRKKDGW